MIFAHGWPICRPGAVRGQTPAIRVQPGIDGLNKPEKYSLRVQIVVECQTDNVRHIKDQCSLPC